MARNKTVTIVSGVVLRRCFGLQKKTLESREVPTFKTDSGTLGYSLDDVVRICGDLILNYLSDRYTINGESYEELKLEKLREEARKLKIDNDTRDGLLVPASDVFITYQKHIRAICDILDALPSRVKMENPDVSSAQLDSINRCLIEVRNKAADWRGD